MRFVVAPSQYDIMLGKNWKIELKANMDRANNRV